jgi:hypothetical protein
VCFTGVSLIAFWLQRKNAAFAKSAGSLGTGLFLPVVAIGIFKLTLAPSNDLLNAGNFSETVSFLLTPARYAEVFREISNYPEPLGGWTFPFLPVFFLFIILAFQKNHQKELFPKLIIGIIILFQWSGYFLTYVITPHDIMVHVVQSYERLIMHIYPALLFWIFLFLKPLEIFFEKKNNQSLPAV